MKHVIIGTAGHVDHGKTLLVKALTGIDTDRLVEEKKRGITIELGFAHLDFDDGTQAGIVDVPGHEKFIKNMLAGAGGIDLAILVVAADEGFMPQTVEHLGILQLLGIREGLVVITKTDMVDGEWVEMVKEDVKEQVAITEHIVVHRKRLPRAIESFTLRTLWYFLQRGIVTVNVWCTRVGCSHRVF